MAGTTTAFCTSAKSDFFSALDCFNAIVSKTSDTHTSVTVDNMGNVTGIAVGMSVTGSGVAANTVVARILSSTSVELSKATTTTVSATSITFTADSFKIALVKVTPTGTYGAATTNYTDLTGNSDETSGTGYTAGGVAMTNVSPTTSGTTAFINWSPDPSWTSASFSTTGAIIYNNTQRGPVATRSISVHDFGGTQTVASGTFTAVMPVAAAGSAILRLA
jgi:hypothetical protein